MITEKEMGELFDRTSIINHLTDSNYNTVLDVGASYSSWSLPYITHAVDLLDNGISGPRLQAVHFGNISYNETWTTLKDKMINEWNVDKFDFCICSHTLEDVAWPVAALTEFPKIAKAGYIIVPSKWCEVIRTYNFTKQVKGWAHHRWLFDVLDGCLWMASKLSFVERYECKFPPNPPDELRFYWSDDIPFKIVNNDIMHPSYEYYLEEFDTFMSADQR